MPVQYPFTSSSRGVAKLPCDHTVTLPCDMTIGNDQSLHFLGDVKEENEQHIRPQCNMLTNYKLIKLEMQATICGQLSGSIVYNFLQF